LPRASLDTPATISRPKLIERAPVVRVAPALPKFNATPALAPRINTAPAQRLFVPSPRATSGAASFGGGFSGFRR
jgi:hypothetical protein